MAKISHDCKLNGCSRSRTNVTSAAKVQNANKGDAVAFRNFMALDWPPPKPSAITPRLKPADGITDGVPLNLQRPGANGALPCELARRPLSARYGCGRSGRADAGRPMREAPKVGRTVVGIGSI